MEDALQTEETRFVQSALQDDRLNWSYASLGSLARRRVPDQVLGEQRLVLRADINRQWGRWFVESLADPQRYASSQLSYPRIFADVHQSVTRRFGNLAKPKQRELASAASSILMRTVERLKADRNRSRWSKEERRTLLDSVGGSPRCWICGARFSRDAVHNFCERDARSIPLPPFVDILKPRGLNQRDLSIEIDHIIPHSLGGSDEDNLALACGWCNRHKQSYGSIYDVVGRPKKAGKNSFGATSLPQPFWTVRLMATIRRCEHPNGCSESADTTEITVAPRDCTGSLNPVNLCVTCKNHDPYKVRRLQSCERARRTWMISPR